MKKKVKLIIGLMDLTKMKNYKVKCKPIKNKILQVSKKIKLSIFKSFQIN